MCSRVTRAAGANRMRWTLLIAADPVSASLDTSSPPGLGIEEAVESALAGRGGLGLRGTRLNTKG